MNTIDPDATLERTLLALERELLDASDEDVVAAAKALGMNPEMQWSAAYFGVTMLARPRFRWPDSEGPTIVAGSWRRPGDGPRTG